MKILVISDTHLSNNPVIPDKILQQATNCNAIIHGGDFINFAAYQKFKKLGKQLFAVYGNMDEPKLIQTLPEKLIFKLARYSFGLVHSMGNMDQALNHAISTFAKQNLNMVIFGHSHQWFFKRHINTLILNPGSPTDKFFATENSFAILKIDQKIEVEKIYL